MYVIVYLIDQDIVEHEKIMKNIWFLASSFFIYLILKYVAWIEIQPILFWYPCIKTSTKTD